MLKVVSVKKDEEFILSTANGLRFRGCYEIVLVLLVQIFMGISDKFSKDYNTILKDLKKTKIMIEKYDIIKRDSE